MSMWPFQIQDEAQKVAPDSVVGNADALEHTDAKWPSSKATVPPVQEEVSGNFVIRSDGTVTDTRTGLMWMRCVMGQTWDGATCARDGKSQKYIWNEAMTLRHSFAGHDDWRLPSIDELKSVFAAFDTKVFPDCLINPVPEFWSSSLDDSSSNHSPLSMSLGCTCRDYPERAFRVRLVRGGQSLGTVKNNATTSPAQALPAFAQVEAHTDVPGNIIASPIEEEAPGDFVIRSDGTVTDTRTGIMWMRCALGQTWDGTTCTGQPQNFTWDQAMALRHSFAGYDDWRLPSIDELKSIVDKTRGSWCAESTLLSDTPNGRFWSSSPYAGYCAWFVVFGSNYVGNDLRNLPGYVRLVRGIHVLGDWDDADESHNVNISTHDERSVNIQAETQMGAPGNIVGGVATLEQADAEWPFSKATSTPIDAIPALTDAVDGNNFVTEDMLCFDNSQASSSSAIDHVAQGFEYLLHEIATNDSPSALAMKAFINPRIFHLRFAHDRSLLHHAARYGKMKTVRYLTKKAEINLQDAYGHTPLDYAIAANHLHVADYLRSKGALTKHQPSIQPHRPSLCEDASVDTAKVSPVGDMPPITDKDALSIGPVEECRTNNPPILEEASGDYVISGSVSEESKCLSQDGHAASVYAEQCNAAKHWTPKQKLLVQQRAETLVHALKNYLGIVANQSNDRETREQGLQDARYVLTVLKMFPGKFPFLHLDNLQAVEASIVAVEAETRLFSFGYAAASMTGNIVIHSDGEKSKPLPQDAHTVDESAGHIDILWADGRSSGAPIPTGETDGFFTKPASNCAPTDFHVPSPPELYGAAKWIPKGQPVTIAGVHIPNGMVYVGTESTSNDQGLIDPTKPVAPHGDFSFTEEQKVYYPSYSTISPSFRRGYLEWLASGRSDPESNITLVFLFFFGLERRAIIDTKNDIAALADYPDIAHEIERLLVIYGKKPSSFRNYANRLLAWISLSHQIKDKLYLQPIPEPQNPYAYPIYFRLALGQASMDGVPVPSHLALAWLKLTHKTATRTAATRYPELFDKLFGWKYAEAFGSGMMLLPNCWGSRLKFIYHPASAGLLLRKDMFITFGDTPDVSATISANLQQLVDAVNEELESSRTTPAYQVALLTLELSSAVAIADGDFCDIEENHLREQILSWSHLTPNHQQLLLTHLELLKSAPASLANLKKKLGQLDMSARESIAAFMTTVAQVDGVVLPAEVKILEQIYKALGVDPIKVFSDLHAFATEGKPSLAALKKIEETGFTLDPEKIIALQRDTEKVTALLAGIFTEDEPILLPVQKTEADIPDEEEIHSILGLDKAHATLARKLLSRPQWCREELLAMATDLELMLDGALELINEASFDMYGLAFAEGDDPFVINPEVLEQIEP